MKLRDGGENAFLNDSLAKWTGLGALDGNRTIVILVEDLALDRLAPGVAHENAVHAHRVKLLRIADRKYQNGATEKGIVRVTDLDIFDEENGIDR
jgi:hypothetical protein